MNISNVLYEFTRQIVNVAQQESPLYGTQIHPDIHEDIKTGKTIRIGDLDSARPTQGPNDNVLKINGSIDVIFAAVPPNPTVEARLIARDATENMVDAWLLEIWKSPPMCNIGEIMQYNRMIRPSNTKVPVSILRIPINPKK